jgi:hypothetical protein
VYLSATAGPVVGPDLERGIEVFPGPAERGGRVVSLEELQPPPPYRLYRAVASEQWILCPDPAGGASGLCAAHRQAIDHRIRDHLGSAHHRRSERPAIEASSPAA